MFKKSVLAIAVASISVWSAPASATFSWWGGSSGGGHTHYNGCGHNTGGSSTSSSTGSSTSSSTSTSTSSTGGTTSTTSGTQVPEPGMLGMFGLGLAGLAFARRRRQTGRKLA